MKQFYRLALAGILLGTNLGSFAQQPAPGTPSPEAVKRYFPPNQKPDIGPRFDIEFPGGSPQDLVEALKDASGARPNVIIHPDCTAAGVPIFRLRNVSASQVFNALNTLAEPAYKDGLWRRVSQEEGEIWTLIRPPAADPVTGASQRSFQQRLGEIQAKALTTARICRVFNLNQVLADYSIDDVTTAIKGAWEMLNATDSEPNIKFHKDTKLLIVVGGNDQISVVAEVLRELNNNVLEKLDEERRRKAEKTPAADPAPQKSESKTQ